MYITQEKLAEHLDVSTTYISKIECGRTAINLERLAQVCEYLNISLGEILTGTQMQNNTYMLKEINELLKDCPPELIPLIKTIIKDTINFYPSNRKKHKKG